MLQLVILLAGERKVQDVTLPNLDSQSACRVQTVTVIG